MGRPLVNVVVVTLALVGFFVYVGVVLTDISGEAGREVGMVAVGVNPEAGEAIFWGRGKCSTCHSVGSQGSAVRGPNLADLFTIAGERTKERAARGKEGMTPTDYLVESVIDPSAHIVQGYPDGVMPIVYKPPIGLSLEDIQAVIAYLQTLGGEFNATGIRLPAGLVATAETAEAGEPWKPYMEGDPETGREVFFKPGGAPPCSTCHIVKGEGGILGPDLSTIGGMQTPQYIVESILNPSAVIVAGYGQTSIEMNDGRTVVGFVKERAKSETILEDFSGQRVTIRKEEVKKESPVPVSLMPPVYGDLLTVRQLHDLLVYLMSLK
jgi:putative heme-binding domain-containing protein